TDPRTGFAAKREAATKLASPKVVGTGPREANPAVKKFAKPTAAEAILAAMDADLRAFDADAPTLMPDANRRRIEWTYLDALIDLGDQRIAPVLAKRANTVKTGRARWQWALVAHFLGDGKPFAAFAKDFAAGNVKIPGGSLGLDDLREVVGA